MLQPCRRLGPVSLLALVATSNAQAPPTAAPTTAPAATSAPAASTEADFDAGLVAVHALMQRAKWADARTALLDLVRAHDRKIWVQAQSDALASDLRTCAFFAAAKVPKVADLIHGKVASYDERSGKIKVVYPGNSKDWEGDEELLVNPLVFAGSYTVTASGRAYPSGDETFSLAFDLDPSGDGWFIADCGYAQQDHGRHVVWRDATIRHSKGGDDARKLAEGRSSAKPGKPFTAVLRVGEDRVELLLDNKSLVKCKREKTDFGQVGMWRNSCDEIVLEGKIEPSHLQSRVDAELAKQRETFEKSYDVKKELPAWVFAKPPVTRTDPLSESWIPGSRRGFSKAFGAMMDLVAEGKLAEARTSLAKLGDDDGSPVARAFIDAFLHERAGQPELAEPILTRLLAEDETMSQARALRAEALEAMGRSGEALAELETVLRHDPGWFPAYEQLCALLLRKNRPDDARRLVRTAKTKHGLWDEVKGLETMLAMAARGPNWPRRFVHQSPHYEVVSDIDAKVCIEACRVLEQSHVNLMSQLSWIKEDKTQPRFRVFLFSGEAGYQEYNKLIIGEAVPHSAGLYTPVLKQLLIWNLPRREDMVRTIRHEGFHQFLDRLMDNPPSWFNEGTAEFWETAAYANGRLQGGQVRPDHLATLARSRKALPKVQQFVYGGRADFYASAQLRYAQAWALVHFLRKGPPAYTVLFDKLWTELRAAKGTKSALDAAFAGVDWEKLEKDFWAHVATIK